MIKKKKKKVPIVSLRSGNCMGLFLLMYECICIMCQAYSHDKHDLINLLGAFCEISQTSSGIIPVVKLQQTGRD